MGSATRNVIDCKLPKQNRKYSIIIPAAGSGVRMKKYGPKSLIRVNNKENIFERQCRIIDKVFRWYEIILVTGFQYEKVEKNVSPKITIVQNTDFDTTNVIRSIGLGLDHCTTNNVIILYGDLVFNEPVINVAFDNESTAIISDTMKKEEVGCSIDNEYIEQVFYGLDNKWAQILFFEAINYIVEKGGKIKTIIPKNAKIIDIDTSLDIKRIKDVV